jgi:DUF4097 and DUF4098 domain-containing protein YvlB
MEPARARNGALSRIGHRRSPMKRFLFFLVGLGFLFVAAIGVTAACVVHAGRSMSFGSVFENQASRAEERALEVASGGRLEIDLLAGNVRITSSAGSAASMNAKITASGSTDEEAKQLLAETKLEVESVDGGVRVRLASPERENRWFHTHSASADLEIRLPDGVRLDVRTKLGDVGAKGAFGATTARSSYGKVRVRGVEGDLEATSSSGDVEVEEARGARVVAKSSYGSVGVRKCQAEDLEVRSGSGDLAVEDWKGARATIQTSYGKIDARKMTGNVEAKSSSGDVGIDDVDGAVTARSSYGAVRVSGVLSALEVDSSSGDVSVTARSGSRIDGEWTIATSYGKAKLVVPPDLAFDVDAKTNYGEISSSLQVATDGSAKASSKSLKGKVHGGGGVVRIHCTSGDVRLGSGGRS